MQLKGFRRAILSLLYAANCLSNCSSSRSFSMYVFTISPPITQTKKCLGMYVGSSGCSQQFAKGIGAPKLVHSM